MRRVACLREGWTGTVCQSGVTLRLAGSRSSQDCHSSRRLTGPAVDQWTTRNHHAAQQINKKTQQQQHPPCRWLWGYSSPDTQPLHTEAAVEPGQQVARCATADTLCAHRCQPGRKSMPRALRSALSTWRLITHLILISLSSSNSFATTHRVMTRTPRLQAPKPQARHTCPLWHIARV